MSSLDERQKREYTQAEVSELYPRGLTLVLVQLIFRHGERAPVRARLEGAGIPERFRTAVRLPGDAGTDSAWDTLRYERQVETTGRDGSAQVASARVGSKELTQGICTLGELTDKGRRTTLELGQRFRELYVNKLGFLPENINSDAQIYLRSSPMPRALESLQQVFTGLYPPVSRPPAFEPVIRVRNFTEENLYPNEGQCKKLAALAAEFAQKAADKWNPILAGRTSQLFSKYISGPVRIDGSPRLSGLMDSVNAARGNDLPLPKELEDPEMLAELQQAAVTLQTNECKADKQVDEWYGGYKTNNVYRRLGAGRLLGDFRDQMNASVNGSTLKVALYGCHDTTLGSMLTSIGAFDDKWPPFTSHVALELFEQKATSLAGYFGSKDYFVRVRYNNEVMPVPACKNPNLCTMKEFNKIVDELVPQNWAEECRAGVPKETTSE